MEQTPLKLVIDSVRSAHNVGSIFRSAEVFGVDEVILTGISPYPKIEGDSRSPQVIERNERMIAKTALDTQKIVPYRYIEKLEDVISSLKEEGYSVYALEQSKQSIPLQEVEFDSPCALIVGHELDGVAEKALAICDAIIEIPQLGRKESLNVSVATGIALYQIAIKVKLTN